MEHKYNLEAPGQYVVTHRQGLPEANMSNEDIECSVSSIRNLIPTRTFEPKLSLCVISKQRIASLRLNLDNTPNTFVTRVTGKLILSKEISDMKINGDTWSPKSLAKFIRQNGHLFESKVESADLWTKLMQFSMRKNVDIKNDADTRGNTAVSKDIKTKSNLPERINVFIPIFTGTEKLVLPLNIDLDPESDGIYLICETINEAMDWIWQKESLDVEKAATDAKIPVVYT